MLGLNLIALAREAGARRIVVTDVSSARLAAAERFGADLCLNPAELGPDDTVSRIRSDAGGHGVDVAFEVCGSSDAVGQGIEALRIGGRYLIAGLVTPGSELGVDGNQLTRKCLTMMGIHNYGPRHLGSALKFLAGCMNKYPYRDLVGATFPLAEINEAVSEADSGRHIRVAIKPPGGEVP